MSALPRSFTVTRPGQAEALAVFIRTTLEARGGKPLRVTVSARPGRTTAQNAYLHVAIGALAEHVGMGADELKEHLKREYGPRIVRSLGNRDVTLPKSTAEYSTLEAAAMIEHVHRIAAECGLLLEPRSAW